jgi:hypothetical protein
VLSVFILGANLWNGKGWLQVGTNCVFLSVSAGHLFMQKKTNLLFVVFVEFGEEEV